MSDAAVAPGPADNLSTIAPGPAPERAAPTAPDRTAPDNDRTRGHSPARDAREAAAARAAAGGGDDQPVKIGDDLTLTPAEMRAVLERIAAEKSGQLSAPADPAGYKAELPSDFKAPEGVEYKINEAAPEFARAREWAHRHHVSQEAFSDLLGLYAGLQMGEATTLQAAQRAELGAAGPERIDALQTWFKGTLGDKDAATLSGVLWTADIVSAFEKLMGRAMRSGTNFSAAHRDHGEPDDGRIPGFDQMSFVQRMAAIDAYNARHGRGRR
jgi:hypothetical protein